MPELGEYDACVDHGSDGMPHQLKVGGPFESSLLDADGNESRKKCHFTFFDETDLRRIALGLARRRRGGLEQKLRAAESIASDVRRMLDAQAKAAAEVEGAIGR